MWYIDCCVQVYLDTFLPSLRREQSDALLCTPDAVHAFKHIDLCVHVNPSRYHGYVRF